MRGRVRNFYIFSTYLLDVLVGLTPLHLNKNTENEQTSFG